VRQLVVLSGGEGNDASELGFGPSPDTWTWDGRAWKREEPAHQPLLIGPVATFDPARGLVLMVGLRDSEFEAWTWDGHDWRRQAAPAGLGRATPALGYDPPGRAILLFGGQREGRRLDDTWAFDASGWRQLKPATTPPARSQGGLAVDPANGRLTLVGGLSDGAPPCAAYAWNGSDWTAGGGTGKPNTVLPPFSDGRRLLALSAEIHDHAWVNRLWSYEGPVWKRAS
jgi:hypothetical protein